MEQRVWQHKHGEYKGFTTRYHPDQLVWYEGFGDLILAITREKELKGWRRSKKNDVVTAFNPRWADLSSTLFERL